MLLAIAERINDPALSNERVAAWTRAWREHRLRAMLSTPAMVLGTTRRRLHEFTGLPEDIKVVNLLPPDNKIGTWCTKQAEWSADVLRDHIRISDRFTGIILLGRRVHEAFHLYGLEFGTLTATMGCPQPFLLLPHPSGRNRAWNDPLLVASMRRAVVRFNQLAQAGVNECSRQVPCPPSS